MSNYHFSDGLIALYVQLTPWVQTLLGLGACIVVLGIAYFLKETIIALTRPFHRTASPQKALQKYPEGFHDNQPTD